ncbi:MAG: hypothetical protein QM784_11595 [Polyangiaceae bacterium]
MLMHRVDRSSWVHVQSPVNRWGSLSERLGRLAVALVLSAFAGACASGEASESLTPEGRETADVARSVAGSEAALTITVPEPEYFAAVRDLRKCASPRCGGYFVRAVNQPLTRCADDTLAERCYVAELDLSVFGDEPPTLGREAVLHGRIESNVFPNFGNLGRFVATEAWSSATSALGTGAFFRLADTGIRCIAAPCFSISAELLNTDFEFRLSSLDLSAVGADAEAQKRALAALGDGNLVAAGRLRMPNVGTRLGLELNASQFYLPLRVRCLSNADCAKGERCNAADVCLPPPGCRRGEVCPAVCSGYCVSAPAACSTDADCPSGNWCRVTEAGGRACVPFAKAGSRCDGFTVPWAYERCSPELVCDLPEMVADAPGICRLPCKTSAGCASTEYCGTDSLCHADGSCDRSIDCVAAGNDYIRILCVGYPVCSGGFSNGRCGWHCGDPRCTDLRGFDFGRCGAILGWAVVSGKCTQVSGCSAGNFKLFPTQADCSTSCGL